MAATIIRCDQAIFTSVRTPMGEGYRIIAASRGLRHGERQMITKYSPSHDALCASTTDHDASTEGIRGVSFYPLPSGRLCVAFSCFAGAEHTGRGGKRIYTHNLILEKQDFQHCAYNPFTLLRSLIQAGGTSPQLKPPPVLPEVQVSITESALEWTHAMSDAVLGPAWRGDVLQTLINEQDLIVNLADRWIEATEALLMGLPGPMREGMSFSAGLRFSVGRCHRLSLLYDDQGTAKKRIAGQHVEYVDSTTMPKPTATSHTSLEAGCSDRDSSAWLSFVERHWREDRLAKLARRTSKAFTDVSEVGRERVGRLYNQIDAIPQTGPAELLQVAGERLEQPASGVEGEITSEFVANAQQALLRRLSTLRWDEASRLWQKISALWRRSDETCRFANPLISAGLRLAGSKHPVTAAEAALEVATLPIFLATAGPAEHGAALKLEHTGLVDGVLARLAEWAEHAANPELEASVQLGRPLKTLVARWRAARPGCPLVERTHRACEVAAAPTT